MQKHFISIMIACIATTAKSCSVPARTDTRKKLQQQSHPTANSANPEQRSKLEQQSHPTANSANPEQRSKPAGLPNLGNTCYLNATLQVIAALYKDDVHGALKEVVDAINNNISLNATTTHTLLYNLQKESSPELLASEIDFFSGNGNAPGILLGALNRTYTFSKYFEYYNRFWLRNGHIKNNSLFFVVSPKPDPYKMASFQIGYQEQGNLSELLARPREIKQLIAEFQIEPGRDRKLPTNEKLSSYVQNQWCSLCCCCRSCRKYSDSVEAIQQRIIKVLPDKIYIDRSSPKNLSPMPISGTEQIQVLLDPNRPDIYASFALKGFISGTYHARAYVNRNGKWYEANDSLVKGIEKDEALLASQGAFLLFYQKE